MNEFIEQFLLEAREYVELAAADLLALEVDPADAGRLDGAFRAVHTLKGAAGIVDFDAMARALHAAEDVLAGVRAGHASISPALVSACLACLDQVVRWLDRMAQTGAPPTDADAEADAVIAAFADAGTASASHIPAPVASSSAASVSGTLPAGAAAHADASADADWVEAMCARHPDAAAHARAALRYTPDPASFFRHEDPLARLEALPGLLALDLSPRGPRPVLEDMDPFACLLILDALLAEAPDPLAARLADLRGQVEIRAVEIRAVELAAPSRAAAAAGRPAEAWPPGARELLEAQLALFADDGVDGRAGRWGSAGRTAAAVLRAGGRAAAAADVERIFAASHAAGSAAPLVAALEAVLAGRDPAQAPVAEPRAEGPAEVARTLRVETERVDELVTLTGELTVVKNALGHAARLARTGADPQVVATLLKDQHALLDRLVGQMQHAVLGMRVLPLRQVFQRFPRVVRDLARSLGKPARLDLVGEDTEADKVIVEALFEPLLHVVRNAMDHGLEDANQRVAAGKPHVARLRIAAMRAGDRVVVEVSDDGGGIDIPRVRRLAADRGVRPAEVIAAMPDAEVVDLIFAPGFSTAAQVSELSGRGVGMDAVRTAIARLGGRVSVESRSGQGTLVRFLLPFTLIMTRVMTLEVAGQVFGLPLDAVVETVHVPRARIGAVGAARAFVLRDRTVPLIDLSQILGLAPAVPDLETRDEAVKVVVVSVGGLLGALEVERLGERIDVMLKPLDGLLSGMPGIAGTTVLGDGRVLLVLDVEEVLR